MHVTYAAKAAEVDRCLFATIPCVIQAAGSSEVEAGGKHDVALEHCAAALAGALHACAEQRAEIITVARTFAAVSRAALPTARAASATWGETGHVT